MFKTKSVEVGTVGASETRLTVLCKSLHGSESPTRLFCSGNTFLCRQTDWEADDSSELCSQIKLREVNGIHWLMGLER